MHILVCAFMFIRVLSIIRIAWSEDAEYCQIIFHNSYIANHPYILASPGYYQYFSIFASLMVENGIT